MSLNDLYLIVGIVVAVGGAIYAVTRVLNTVLRNQREAHDSKLQKRIEFLRQQLELLQKAASNYEEQVEIYGGISHQRAARAMARSAMQACGDLELNAIADRFVLDDWTVASDLNAMGDGIKRLAVLIKEEAQK